MKNAIKIFYIPQTPVVIKKRTLLRKNFEAYSKIIAALLTLTIGVSWVQFLYPRLLYSLRNVSGDLRRLSTLACAGSYAATFVLNAALMESPWQRCSWTLSLLTAINIQQEALLFFKSSKWPDRESYPTR